MDRRRIVSLSNTDSKRDFDTDMGGKVISVRGKTSLDTRTGTVRLLHKGLLGSDSRGVRQRLVLAHRAVFSFYTDLGITGGISSGSS